MFINIIIRSGNLSRDEFTTALSSMELGLTRREINSLLFQVDANDDGQISYSEFMPFAFDLLRKLTEMRIFETEMAEDELAQFLMDLFKAKDVELMNVASESERAPGTISADDVKELLHEARLGLTRLQIYSVLSVAELNEMGYLNYVQFIPKAVTVIRSMLTFESDLVDQVQVRELTQAIEDALRESGGSSSYSDVQALVSGIEGVTPEAIKGILVSAKSLEQGGQVDTTKLAADVPRIIKNATKI